MAQTQALSLPDVKTKCASLVGIAEVLAKFTPTPKDDAAVRFLRYLLVESKVVEEAFAAWQVIVADSSSAGEVLP